MSIIGIVKLTTVKKFLTKMLIGSKCVCGIQHLTDHLFSRDSVGNMMLIALWSIQLESGCGFHLLDNPSKWVP
jgi:hypothetical protein